MLQPGTKITPEELTEAGWEYVTTYERYEIWIKGDDRILYNPRRNIVYYSYR